MAWEESLNKLQLIWVAAIRVAGEDLRSGIVGKVDLHKMINEYKRCSFRSLQAVVQEGIMKKLVQEAARKMVEWEAEEASGDESVDSFE